MQIVQNKKHHSPSLTLSILLHLIIFCLFIRYNQQPVKEYYKKPPQDYVPAYTYTGAITPSTTTRTITKSQRDASLAPETPSKPLKYASQHVKPYQSVLDMSRAVMQQNQMEQALANQSEQEPILLVGDTHEVADPLVRLMGRALSANFRYPKMEGSFGIRGRVLVDLIFHPEGYFSDPRIVESSDTQDFDAAALYAVNQAPKVVGADRYLMQPKHFLIGFIFN